MGCEESFITIKLIWHSYLVLSLANCAHKTRTETGLKHLRARAAQAPGHARPTEQLAAQEQLRSSGPRWGERPAAGQAAREAHLGALGRRPTCLRGSPLR